MRETIASGLALRDERFDEIDKQVKKLFGNLDKIHRIMEDVVKEIQVSTLGEEHFMTEYEREVIVAGYCIGSEAVLKRTTKRDELMVLLCTAVDAMLEDDGDKSVHFVALEAILTLIKHSMNG